MATTLADINKTLIEQNKSLEETSEGINGLVDKISAQMEVAEKTNLKQLEEKRESGKTARVVNRPKGLTEGFMKGTGLDGLAGMLSNIIPAGLGGMLAGAIGLAFGKLFKGAVVGGLIATFFGAEIMTWVRSTFDKDGDGKIFEGMPFELDLNSTATIAALTLATGVIANALVGFVAKGLVKLGVKGIAKLFAGVGGLLAAGLGLGGGGDVPTESGNRRRGGKEVKRLQLLNLQARGSANRRPNHRAKRYQLESKPPLLKKSQGAQHHRRVTPEIPPALLLKRDQKSLQVLMK